ncbi:MAG TPA: N-acetyltransferase [Bacillota bacterium]|jgi:amino-acid N-acetyltransferase
MKTEERLTTTTIIRKARAEDIPQAHALIDGYARQGLMLRRPMTLLYESLRDLVVAADDGRVVAVGGLHIMWSDLAEVRSLAVSSDYRGQGVGRRMVEYMMGEAEAMGLSRVFALTYQQAFFAACSFTVIDKAELPQKVWKECVYCDRFENCDEIAVIRRLPG